LAHSNLGAVLGLKGRLDEAITWNSAGLVIIVN
jgi:hypothetical protein